MARHIRDRWRDFLGPGAVPSLLFAGFLFLAGLGLPWLWRVLQVWRRCGENEPGAADLIVVLGRTLEHDQPTRVFRARLARGAELWQEGVAPTLWVAGGLTGTSSRTEAAAGLEELRKLGIPESALRAEDTSRHTLENLFHIRELLGHERSARLLIVSDPIHTTRISAYATGLGLDHRFAPAFDAAPRTWLGRWARILHEACFLHWYHAGVLYSRLTRNHDYLARVT